MALCLVHGAAGYLAYEAIRPAWPHRPGLLAAAVALANGADVDFVPGLLSGQPAAYHRGVTHSVAAVAAVALVTALAVPLVSRRRRIALRAAGWAAALWASHLVVDYFTHDVVPPSGARFLWPFSDHYWIAPVTPLSEIVIDRSGRLAFFHSIFNAGTVHVWIEEIVLLVGVVIAVHAVRGWPFAAAWRDAGEET